MSIIRAKRTQNFTIISNKVYEKHVLSWQAMGMLGYLLSKPDDWRVVVPELVNVTKDTKKQTGREGVYNILKELEEKGYLIRKKNQDGTVDSFIFDEPKTVELESAQPNQAQPNQAQPHVLIRTEKQQELNNKKELNNKNNNNAHAEACATKPACKPKAKAAKKSDAMQADLAALENLGVDSQTAKDWLVTRKEKRAGSLTQTVLTALQREASKAGLTVAQAVQVAAERNWARFVASYLQRESQGFAGAPSRPANKINAVPKHTGGGVYLAKDVL